MTAQPARDQEGLLAGAPFEVPHEWIDHNGHVNLARYADAFYRGARQLSDHLGMTADFKAQTNTASFAAELCISYRREVPPGALLRVDSRVLGFDPRRVHSWHELVLVHEDQTAATGELMGLNIDRATRTVADMPDELLARLQAFAETVTAPLPTGTRLDLERSDRPHRDRR